MKSAFNESIERKNPCTLIDWSSIIAINSGAMSEGEKDKMIYRSQSVCWFHFDMHLSSDMSSIQMVMPQSNAMQCDAMQQHRFYSIVAPNWNCRATLFIYFPDFILFSRNVFMKKNIIIRLMASAASVWMGFASLKSDMRINSNRMELLFSFEKILLLCIRQMLINSSDT